MGFRILGAPTETELLTLQGDVALDLTPASGLTFNSFGPVADPPRLSDYDTYISTYGPTHASTFDQDWQNYDGDMVHRFLADYTGNEGTYMPTSRAIRDDYWLYSAVTNNYPAAHLMYPNGLYHHAVESGFPSGSGLGGPSTVAEAFANWLDAWNFSYNKSKTEQYGQVYSRPVAYCLLTAVRGEQLAGASNFNSLLGYSGNYPLSYRYETMLGKAENHLRQWRDNDYTNPSNTPHVKPFMVGLTCYALAQYYEQNGNANWQGTRWPDLPTAVEDMLTWMYDTAPNHDVGGQLLQTNYAGAGTYDTFPYADREYTNPNTGSGGSGQGSAPDLNMLIAPAYAWLGKHYSDSTYVTNYADRLFAGQAYMLSTGDGRWYAENTTKQYNQFFYYAQEYFTWRQQV